MAEMGPEITPAPDGSQIPQVSASYKVIRPFFKEVHPIKGDKAQGVPLYNTAEWPAPDPDERPWYNYAQSFQTVYNEDHHDVQEIYLIFPNSSFRKFERTEPSPDITVDIEEYINHWFHLLLALSCVLDRQGREMLREDGILPRMLMRSLMRLADVIQDLQTIFPNDIPEWRFEFLSPAKLGIRISELIQRAAHIMSIDEAYKSNEQAESMKRLTWITFICLPLLFVSGLFGMNIDILERNPPWWYYFVVLGPVTFAIVVAYLALKHQAFPPNNSGRAPSVMEIRKRLIAAAQLGHIDEIMRILATVSFMEKGEYSRVVFYHIHPAAREKLREKIDYDSGDPVGESTRRKIRIFLERWCFGLF